MLVILDSNDNVLVNFGVLVVLDFNDNVHVNSDVLVVLDFNDNVHVIFDVLVILVFECCPQKAALIPVLFAKAGSSFSYYENEDPRSSFSYYENEDPRSSFSYYENEDPLLKAERPLKVRLLSTNNLCLLYVVAKIDSNSR